MANAAMALLDRRQRQAGGSIRGGASPRADADLGFAVPKYNFQLVAHATGQLAAEIGSRIATGFTGNEDKARYLTALLIGPVYQAFDGVPTARDSGLLHASTGSSSAYIQKVFELVKPVLKSTIELLSAGQRQVKDRQKDLLSKVAALRGFLDKNAPADRHLVPDGAAISDRAFAGRRSETGRGSVARPAQQLIDDRRPRPPRRVRDGHHVY